MPQPNVIMYILLFLIAWGSLSAWMAKDKVHCTLRRRDSTIIDKDVKPIAGTVILEGYKYEVVPNCVAIKFVTKGIHLIFPTWMRQLDYRWDSTKPLNPKDFSNTLTPEERTILNLKDELLDLEGSTKQALGVKGKETALTRWMPIILIVVLVIVGYLAWNQSQLSSRIDMVGIQGNSIQEMLVEMMKKMGIR